MANTEDIYTDEEMMDGGQDNGQMDPSSQESKADKFRRIATIRTNSALKAINGLGKLSTPAYESTPEQIEKIFTALQKALDNARDKFIRSAEEEQEFTL